MNTAEPHKYDKSNLTGITNPKTQIMTILETVMAERIANGGVTQQTANAPTTAERMDDAQTRLQDCEYELTQTMKDNARLRTALNIKTTENQRLALENQHLRSRQQHQKQQIDRQNQQIERLLETLKQNNRLQMGRAAHSVSLPLVSSSIPASLRPTATEEPSIYQTTEPAEIPGRMSSATGSEVATAAVAKRMGTNVLVLEPEAKSAIKQIGHSPAPEPTLPEPVLAAARKSSNPRIDLPQLPRN